MPHTTPNFDGYYAIPIQADTLVNLLANKEYSQAYYEGTATLEDIVSAITYDIQLDWGE